MDTIKRQGKKRRCRQHRKEQYLHALYKVIDGKAKPEYATKRWEKMKEVEKK